jgi:hypothetical protein
MDYLLEVTLNKLQDTETRVRLVGKSYTYSEDDSYQIAVGVITGWSDKYIYIRPRTDAHQKSVKIANVSQIVATKGLRRKNGTVYQEYYRKPTVVVSENGLDVAGTLLAMLSNAKS